MSAPGDPDKPDQKQPSGSEGGTGSFHPPARSDAKSPTEPGRVARNGSNVLDLPLTRLKLGTESVMPADVTRYRVWVPTDTGGDLTITALDGGTVELRRPLKKVIKPAAVHLNYEVPKGEFGEYFVIAKATAGQKVLCTFMQTSFARDGTRDSDPPLIPWTFWYWPTAQGNMYWDKAGDVMARFGKAFGKDPDACKAAEQTDHKTDKVSTIPFFDWQGHCHLAAPASILFEEPKAGAHNGQKFDADELKFLALEFWGNYGRMLPSVWELKRGKPVGKFHLPAYFKPGEPKNRANLIHGLKHDPKIGVSNEAAEDPQANKQLEELADVLIQQGGGAAGFETTINQWMGELAAEFYQFLIDHIRVEKQPVTGDMRAYEPGKGPEEVWNHALFWYEAFYLEHIPDAAAGEAEDQNDMVISCVLRVNLDNPLDVGPPARISGNKTIPIDLASHAYMNLWRIRFDGAGKIVVTDQRNRWIYIQNSNKEELYTPTKLQIVDKPASARITASNPLDVGNKFLDREVLKSNLLKLRKRYS